jgi:hypothetical protein
MPGNDKHHRFFLTQGGDDYGGESQASPNTIIKWAPVNLPAHIKSDGASVPDVLAACSARLSHLQKTPQASDTNAKALWEIVKAMDILNGNAPAVGAGFGATDAKPGN